MGKWEEKYRLLEKEYENLKEENANLLIEKINLLRERVDIVAEKIALKEVLEAAQLPQIDFVEVNEKVVIIHWQDGSYTKAVCQGKDSFDFEIGFSICYMKKIFGVKEFYKLKKTLPKKVIS